MFAASREPLRLLATALLLVATAACGVEGDASQTAASAPSPTGTIAEKPVPAPSDLLYTEGDHVGILDALGGRQRLAQSAPSHQGDADWSRDGTSVVFATGRTQLWVLNNSGWKAMRIHRCKAPCWALSGGAWSPDGKQIAFALTESEDRRHTSRSVIKVLDLAAAEVRAVYASSSPRDRFLQPRWSPEGSSLVFEQDTFEDNRLDTSTVVSSRIGVVSLKRGEPRFIASGHGQGPQTPDWGRRGIVFSSGGNLFAVKPDGGSPRRLTSFDGTRERAVDPAYSPRGGRIVFTYVTRSNGSNGSTGSTGSTGHPAAALINAGRGGFALISGGDGVTHPRLKP